MRRHAPFISVGVIHSEVSRRVLLHFNTAAVQCSNQRDCFAHILMSRRATARVPYRTLPHSTALYRTLPYSTTVASAPKQHQSTQLGSP